MNKLIQLIAVSRNGHILCGKIHQHLTLTTTYSTKAKKDKESDLPKNDLVDIYPAISQQEKGRIYDKKPFRLRLEAGKYYAWCTCGSSKSQPICDGTHANVFLKIKQKPVKFKVRETKDYWLCNCKQTEMQPFCDGTHLRADIQETRGAY